MFSVCDYLTILPHVPNKKERTHTCALYYLTLFGRVTQSNNQNSKHVCLNYVQEV